MSNNYSRTEVEQLAAIFAALSNPQRLRIFLKLASGCLASDCAEDEVRYCVADLGADLPMAPSTLSHHLKELRQAGLMTMERNGRRIECSVRLDTLRRLSALFTDVPGSPHPGVHPAAQPSSEATTPPA